MVLRALSSLFFILFFFPLEVWVDSFAFCHASAASLPFDMSSLFLFQIIVKLTSRKNTQNFKFSLHLLQLERPILAVQLQTFHMQHLHNLGQDMLWYYLQRDQLFKYSLFLKEEALSHFLFTCNIFIALCVIVSS